MTVYSNTRKTDSGATRVGLVQRDGEVYVATISFRTVDGRLFHGDTLRTTDRDEAITYARGVDLSTEDDSRGKAVQ